MIIIINIIIIILPIINAIIFDHLINNVVIGGSIFYMQSLFFEDYVFIRSMCSCLIFRDFIEFR